MNVDKVFCENCGKYISDLKELDKMLVREVLTVCCKDCGHYNRIQKIDKNSFSHFRFRAKYKI